MTQHYRIEKLSPALMASTFLLFSCATASAYVRSQDVQDSPSSMFMYERSNRRTVMRRNLDHKGGRLCPDGTCMPTPEPSSSPVPTDLPLTNVSPISTSTPSMLPSSTRYPTPIPSATPTSTPTETMRPTSDVWTITQDTDQSFTSRCIEYPPVSILSSTFATLLEFDYYLYLSDGDLETASKEAAEIGSLLHTVLTKNALACEYDADEIKMAVVELSSNELNTVVVGECQDIFLDTTTETCWWVSAKTTATMFSTLSDSEIIDQFSLWIDNSLRAAASNTNATMAELQGFTNLVLGVGKDLAGTDVTSGTKTEASALNRSNVRAGDKSTNSLGALILGAAATVLVVFAVFLVIRRNKRQKAYMERFDEVSELGLDPQLGAESEHHTAVIINADIFNVGSFDVVEPEIESIYDTHSGASQFIDHHPPIFISAKREK